MAEKKDARAEDAPAKAEPKKAEPYTGPRLPEPQMVLASERWEKQQLAREIAERAEDPLDVAKVKGGKFLNEQGFLVNAEGQFIEEDGTVREGKDGEPATGVKPKSEG